MRSQDFGETGVSVCTLVSSPVEYMRRAYLGPRPGLGAETNYLRFFLLTPVEFMLFSQVYK